MDSVYTALIIVKSYNTIRYNTLLFLQTRTDGIKIKMADAGEGELWAMPSARIEVLRVLLIERRRQANLTQAQLAEKLGDGWHQSTVASVESGQRKIDVLEFLKIAEALEFDPADFLKTLATVRD